MDRSSPSPFRLYPPPPDASPNYPSEPAMDLDAQIASLQTSAPDDGVTGNAITTIAPTLKAIAGQLKHEQYYVLQTLEQGWMMTTLSNRTQPNTQKNIVYAYPTLQDAATSQATVKDPQVMALPVPVVHILFQLLAMQPIDSLIFFETPGQASQGVEIRRQDMQALIQAQLQQAQQGNPIPPNMA
ncbi:hypothetical protein VB780_14040 [Leptolyngbya sp. CCNP1308]|nr:hypothetical protein [Leptolyngbya sp. CCNP1308]